jgi:hypothetical protein
MIRALRSGSLVGLVVALACGTDRPTASPDAPSAGDAPAQQLPVGEAVTYLFSGPLDHAVNGVTTRSQYLLYGNGVFGLRYDSSPRAYLGMYRENDGIITFWFDGQWSLDQGTATGTVRGGLLEIRYSGAMRQSEFHNAVYRRLP